MVYTPASVPTSAVVATKIEQQTAKNERMIQWLVWRDRFLAGVPAEGTDPDSFVE